MADRVGLRIVVLAAFVLAVPAVSPEEAAPPVELVRGLLGFDPTAGVDAPAEWLVGSDGTARFLVQFDGPVVADARSRLDAVALAIHDYVPHNAFLVTLDPRGQDEVSGWRDVRATVPYHPAFKVSTRLAREGTVDATVLAYRDVPLATALQDLAGAGGTVRGHATTIFEHVIDVTFPTEAVLDIARLETVMWIEPSLDEGGLDNNVASAMTQSGSPDVWSLHDRGIDGRSQIVSICDTGIATESFGLVTDLTYAAVLRTTHEVFEDGSKFVEYNRHLSPSPLPLEPHRKIELYYSPQEDGNWGDATDEHGHGTSTAATLAGDVTPYGNRTGSDGIAPAARLAVCDIHAEPRFFFLNDYANYWKPAYDAGSRINSNSWGAAPTNDYTIPARQHDAYVWDHRDFLILRSMGNSGPQGLMRPEAAAKSVVAVGATLNDGLSEDLSPTTSVGPTTDGRIKPNVVAPGKCLVTAALGAPDAYVCASGTSVSTPLVAGAAALIRDYFERGFHPDGPRSPSAALIRAMLQASGREIAGDWDTPGFPNAAQGWGRVTLDDVLGHHGLIVHDEEQGLLTGDVTRIPFRVESVGPLRVHLAWSDAPAAAGANPALVNDLDLRLDGPGGRTQLPIAGPDRINVDEGIYLDRAPPGDYVIEILGVNVPVGPQTFALVVVGDVA